MASTPTKVPGLPAIPSNASPDLKAYLKALGEALEIRLGRRGDQRDRAITLRELIDSGLAKELKSVPFNPNKSSETHVGISSINGPHLLTPPTPSGFTVSGAFKNVVLNWSDPNFIYSNHSYTEVFRQNAQAADPDGIALAQTMSGSGNLNLNGVLMTENATNGTSVNSSVQFFQPTTVNITSAGNDSGRTFTVTGTNTADGAVTDTITGANAGTATGDQIFKTVTQIAIDGASAGNVSAGPAESADEIGNATSIGTSGSMVSTDAAVAAGEAYFYWIRFVSEEGVAGPFNSTNGTIASTVRIQETDISEDAITTPKLKAGSITADQGVFAAAAIESADIASAAITSAKIAAAAVTNAKIHFLSTNTAAINTAHIVDAAVETLQIKGNAVTVPQIVNSATSNVAVPNSGTTTIFTTATITPTGLSSSLTGDILVTCFGYHAAQASLQGDSGVTLTLQLATNGGSYSNYFTQVSGTETDSGTNYMCIPFSMSVLAENIYSVSVKLLATPLRIQDGTTDGYMASCEIQNARVLLLAAKR